MGKNLLTLADLTQDEIDFLLDIAIGMKKDRKGKLDLLKGKSVGLVFQKPSNRTRVSFEVGIWELGGNCIYLGPEEIDLGKRESPSDVAKTLSRYLHGIVARTHSHKDLVDLANFATVPVINGLSDWYHPCQALADFMTIKEKFGMIRGLTLAYLGDGNNVCHSLLIGGSKLGLNITVATPKAYEPREDIVKLAKVQAIETSSKINFTNSPQEAVRGAHIIYTDVWISMGQEDETSERMNAFKNFQVDEKLSLFAHNSFIFMHCLPAHRGQEVTDAVIDGPHSVVFNQAENRLHTQKAILIKLLGEMR